MVNQVIEGFEKTGNPYKDVLLALEHSRCPFLVIGGVAVVLHGSNRFTPDVNILIDFSSDLFPQAIESIERLGLHPATSIPVDSVPDQATRQELVAAGHTFLRFSDSQLPNFSLDLLLVDIGSFSELYARRVQFPVQNTELAALGLADLIALKQCLNRMQDQVDVMQLELVQKILAQADPENAYEHLQAELPAGFDEAFYKSLVNFQTLSTEERLDWLQNMLAAVGGFCLF